MATTIFIIDDDAAQLGTTEEILVKKLGYQTISALGGKAAIERSLLRMAPKPDLILLDLVMPDVSGVEVTRVIRRSDPNIPIIVLSPYENHAMVLEAMQAGADECLHKPVSINLLHMMIEKLLQRESMRKELSRLSRHVQAKYQFDDLIGTSQAMRTVVAQAKQAAQNSVPVCIEGEEGTGKELLARIIHHETAQSDKPFMPVVCHDSQPIFANWFEGPAESRKTKSIGTVFLGQIDKLSEIVQEKLGDFLMNARANHESPWLHTRFIASTLEPLSKLYRQGRMNEKLYFYFSASSISMPPLSQRREDVIPIATHYLQRFTATDPQMIRELAPDAQHMLMSHDWPGNIPELVKLMQRASYLCQEPVLKAEHLEPLMGHMISLPQASSMQAPSSFKLPGSYSLLNQGGDVKPFEQLEAEIIRFAIEHYGGKMTEVARRLGIGRSTLYRKMQDYKLKQAA